MGGPIIFNSTPFWLCREGNIEFHKEILPCFRRKNIKTQRVQLSHIRRSLLLGVKDNTQARFRKMFWVKPVKPK